MERFKEEVFTVKELSSFLKVSESTLYKYLKSGLLPGKKIGNRWRVLKSEIVSFLKGEKKGLPQRSKENQDQLRLWTKDRDKR